MDVERLISKLFNATYMWKGTTSSYRDTAIHDDEAARSAITEAVYEWATEEITDIDKGKKIAELEAKVYAYEKIIANSNFAPMIQPIIVDEFKLKNSFEFDGFPKGEKEPE